jgi:hypothetical protein
MVRGGIVIGMSLGGTVRLALRCARDSIPQLKLKILLDLAANARSRATDVCERITKPHRTVRRELEALTPSDCCTEEHEQSIADESKIIWRYSLNEDKLHRETLLAIAHPPHSITSDMQDMRPGDRNPL